MTEIALYKATGDFAGDKDIAREIREGRLKPCLSSGEKVTLDFSGVDLATQSFIHALISELIRASDFDALSMIIFKNCNPIVRELIEIVTEYSQEEVFDNSETEESLDLG